MAKTRLPDGTPIRCIVRSEARVLVEHANGYLEHGITLADDAIVFDVGANIGVFYVLLARMNPGIQVHAFEPVPPICAVLQENAEALGEGRITVHPYGVGAEEAAFDFVYFPRCPALSSAHMELWESADPNAFKQAVKGQLAEAGKYIWAAKLVPSFLAGPIAKYLQGGAQKHRCEIRALSHVFENYDVPRVDLLKVDCEGAEIAVLQGIPEQYWPRIQQVVCEVMDVEGRLKICEDLLADNGFDDVVVAREAGLEDTPLVNVYAKRSA